MKKKKSFLMYNDYWAWMKNLSDADLATLIRAMFNYEINGTLSEFTDQCLAVPFEILRQNLDRDNEKYVKICERNQQNAAERWKKTPYDKDSPERKEILRAFKN